MRLPKDYAAPKQEETAVEYIWERKGCVQQRREPIVRCRDCKHFYEDRRDTSIGWVSVFVCDSDQWSTSSLMPSHKVEPDGFCAWGERKADA